MEKVDLKKILANKWLKLVAQIGIVFFSLIYIFQNVKKINLQAVDINLVYLFLALVITMIGTYLGAYSWWISIKSFNQKLSYEESCDIQFKANLAKYIPGYGWQLVGKGYMTVEKGISKLGVTIVMLFEYSLIFLSGLVLSSFTIPTYYTKQLSIVLNPSVSISVIRIIIVIIVLCVPILFNGIIKISRVDHSNFKMLYKWVFILVISLTIIWIINSFGFYLLLYATGYQVGVDFISIVFVFSITFIIGLIIIFVPGSIGVREALFIFLLAPYIPSAIAGVIAIVYRILTITSEIFIYLLNRFRIIIKNKMK